MTTLAFIDTETTGLDPDRHAVWEIAIIIRNPDQPDWEHHWQIRQPELHLTRVAQPEALDIGRYYDRMVIPDDYFVGQIGGDGKPVGMSHKTLAYDLTRILDGAVLIGSNPAFDAALLRVFLDGDTPWHYRTIDVATLAAGFMWAQEPELMAKDTKPISSRWLSRQVGVEPPGEDVAHTALGDARWARDVYDAITRGGQR